MNDYDFLEPAQIELEEEVKYYNEQRMGLGYEFATEVAATISRILRYPEAWTKLSKRTRRKIHELPHNLADRSIEEDLPLRLIAAQRR